MYFISVPGITDASGPQQSSQSAGSTAVGANSNATINGTSIGGLESQMQNLSVSSNGNVAQQTQSQPQPQPQPQPEYGPKRQSSLHSSSVMPSYEASGGVIAGDNSAIYPGSGGENVAVANSISDPSLQQLGRTPYSYGAPTPYYTGSAPLQHATSN